MIGKWMSTVALVAVVFAAAPGRAAESGWTLTGGRVWERRTGPGASLAIGGTSCTGDFCDQTLDVNLFGSFAGTLGFMYRIIPNVVVFLDLNTSYINTDMADDMQDNKGFLFQAVAGGEFHLPITGWLDAYLGFGVGYALLRAKAHHVYSSASGIGEWDEVLSYRGVDLEMKLGGDVYPFSRLPTLSLGVLFRMGFAIWPTACIDQGGDKTCTDPESDFYRESPPDGWSQVSETPFLVFIGLTAKYTFGGGSAASAEASASASADTE